MKIDIDVSKIIAETLENYPSCAHLQIEFETLLQGHLDVMQNRLEVGLRVGGMSEIQADYEEVLQNYKTNFLRTDWAKLNAFQKSVEELKTEREVELQFFQSAVDWFETNRQLLTIGRSIKKGEEEVAQQSYQDQATNFEKQVALFLKGQIDDFEKRLSKSLEETILVKSEIQKVTQWLTDKNLSDRYIFPNPNGGTVISNGWESLFASEGKEANRFPYWYNELIVQGNDPPPFTGPKHKKDLKPSDLIWV